MSYREGGREGGRERERERERGASFTHTHTHTHTLVTSKGRQRERESSATSKLDQGIGVLGAICTGSGRFKHIEPHRTLSNNIIAEIARCVEFCHMSSGGSTVLYLHRFRYAECLYTSAGWFQHIEPHRTFSNHIITQIARCVEFCHMSSGGSTVLYLHRFRGNKVCRVLIH